MKNAEFLHEQIRTKKSMLCVGLDPELHKLPAEYQSSEYPLFDFCRDIIEVTHEYAIAYKINVAFFEAHGPKGWEQLEKILNHIPADSFVIADAKRADIGNTAKLYAEYYFKTLNVDAVTLHPYMGLDSLEPFLEFKNKWSIILALTSNPGSKDFELQKLASGIYLYEFVIQSFLNSRFGSNTMFVCGATHPSEFLKIRSICPDNFLLVPGIGAQGGDLKTIITSGKNKYGGLLVNVSRKICYPDKSKDFKSDVSNSANEYQKEMALYL